MSIEKLTRPSRIDEDRIQKLKELFPEAFTDGKLNLDILQDEINILDEELIELNIDESYGIQWVGKKEARRMAFLPPQGSLKLSEGEGVNEDTTKNILIEGDNLEVLRLLQKSYGAQIKMIYIDPPYNTGTDFIYKDDFKESIENYLYKSGQADEEGLLTSNPKSSGRYHANWLNMMYPRLKLAKNLLKDDGAIFVSIDDNEYANLKKILDEIFGEENYIGTFVWKRRSGSNDALKLVSLDHEYVVCYQKRDIGSFKGLLKDFSHYKNPDNDPRGPWTTGDLTKAHTAEQRPNLFYPITDPETGIVYKCNRNRVWTYEKSRMERLINEGKILFPSDPNKTPSYKRHLAEVKSDRKPVSTWMESGLKKGDNNFFYAPLNMKATKDLRSLFDEQIFDFPKAYDLIMSFILQVTDSETEDIILDFFAGSGTTAQAVLEANNRDNGNRKYILVQVPEKIGHKKYSTICEVTKERIRRCNKKLNEQDNNLVNLDRGFKVYKMDKTNLRKWDGYNGNQIQKLEENLELFTNAHFNENSTDMDIIIEMMLSEGFPLDSLIKKISGINENNLYNISHESVPFNMIVSLDETLDLLTVDYIVNNFSKDVFICLDEALSNEAKVLLSETVKVKTI